MTAVVEVGGKEPSPGPRAWRGILRVNLGLETGRAGTGKLRGT